MTKRCVRLVTLNTWKNEGNYRARLAAMAAGLARLVPDVVMLQEAFRLEDGTADTAATLARNLGLVCVYAPARRKPRLWQGTPRESEAGLALLVRGQILAQERINLPTDEPGGERIALLASIQLVDGRRIFAGCTHLSHLRHDSARRREQLETVLAHPGWSNPASLRVLGGDFNAVAESPEIAWLGQHPSLNVRAVSTVGYVTHPLPPRSGRTGRCIDFLFSVHPPDEAPATARHAAVVLDAPVAGVWPSDHAAVLAEFGVPAAG